MGERAAGSAAAEPKPGANPGGVEAFHRPQPGPSYQPPHTDWIAVLNQKFLPSSKLRLPFFLPTRKSGASVACATSVFRRRHRCFRLPSTASAGILVEWLKATSLVALHGVIFSHIKRYAHGSLTPFWHYDEDLNERADINEASLPSSIKAGLYILWARCREKFLLRIRNNSCAFLLSLLLLCDETIFTLFDPPSGWNEH
ncbi:hypothetical protein B0T13DRAFT_265575 [Neurospora crassa]|nr:hypothetical protein B0T13DRAFT_265575 [Neurospora crassa]